VYPLDLPQKIKVLGFRNLRVPVIRAATEPYDPEKPSLFDKEIQQDVIEVNTVIYSLLGIIKLLTKALLKTGARFDAETWELLKNSRILLNESRNSSRR